MSHSQYRLEMGLLCLYKERNELVSLVGQEIPLQKYDIHHSVLIGLENI